MTPLRRAAADAQPPPESSEECPECAGEFTCGHCGQAYVRRERMSNGRFTTTVPVPDAGAEPDRAWITVSTPDGRSNLYVQVTELVDEGTGASFWTVSASPYGPGEVRLYAGDHAMEPEATWKDELWQD